MQKGVDTKLFRSGKIFSSSDTVNTSQAAMSTYADPVTRSCIYKLFSIAFRYPIPLMFKTFQNGKFLDELIYNTSLIPQLNALMIGYTPLVEHTKDVMKDMALAEFEMKFTRAFDAGIPFPSCPPYEGFYCGKPRSIVMLEVSKFYDCFGLHVSREEGRREFPDHISIELEFLHFLTYKEAHSVGTDDEKMLKGYLLAQKDFLERHLIQWAPKFCFKLQNSEGMPFYTQLAQIMSRFIACEFELLVAKMY